MNNSNQPNKRFKKEMIIEPILTGSLPPQDLSAEKIVLGAILMERDKLQEVVEMMPNDECFYIDQHKVIYRAILDLFAEGIPIDLVTVSSQLQKNGDLERAGGAYFLTGLAMDVVTSAHVETHTRILIEKYIKRELIITGALLQKRGYDDTTDAFELKDEAEERLTAIHNRLIKKDFQHVAKGVDELLMKMEEQRTSEIETTGLRTPFVSLDDVINGWRPGVIIVAARPAVGKTSLGLLSVLELAIAGIPAAFFSLEMVVSQLQSRLFTTISRVPYKHVLRPKMRTAEEHKKVIEAAIYLKTLPLYLDNTPSLGTMEFRAKVKRLVAKGVKLVVLDYLQLMTYSGKSIGNREQEVGNISKELKKLQVETGIPIVALCQTSRGIETRQNKKPMMSDLRESGAIEADADVVMIACNAEETEGDDPEYSKKVLLSVLKNREGTEAELLYYKNNHIQRWSEIDLASATNVFEKAHSPAISNATRLTAEFWSDEKPEF